MMISNKSELIFSLLIPTLIILIVALLIGGADSLDKIVWGN